MSARRFSPPLRLAAGLLLAAAADAAETPPVLRAEAFEHHVAKFNAMEPEVVVNFVPDAQAWDWLRRNVPRFECPDAGVEEIYWFRWWALRKQLRKDPASGRFVFGEFINRARPVSSAFGHHLMEGRWLRDQSYHDDYILYWLRGNAGRPQDHFHRFSQWAQHALWSRWLVTADTAALTGLLDDLVADYRKWEADQMRPDGLFWNYDVRDAMEESISGGRKVKNVRPTISSYMFGNATALAAIARLAGRAELAAEFAAKAAGLRRLVPATLWNKELGFFGSVDEALAPIAVREEIGFIPWYFHLPEAGKGHEIAWRQLTDAAGFNAVRTAHNPPSAAFLAACDRLGLLVMDEIFDGWEKAKNAHDYGGLFKDWWQRDVDAWVRRDRNHPSVVLWSTGNEMFERGNAGGQRIARELTARIKALDPTRPVTAGVNGLGKSGEWTQLDPLFAAFDVAGYNYELGRHAEDHVRLPGRVIVAAESYQSEVFANWAVLSRQPCVIGDFVWSALDYLGEGGIGRVFPPDEPAKKHWEADMWPWHGAYCGDIDLTGWRKPASHYRNIVWDRGEKLYAAVLQPAPGGRPWNVTPWSVPPALPSWTWPGAEGTPLTVEVYSRHEAVRLTLNGKVVGESPTTEAQEFKAAFTVPYAPGELQVAGLRGGKVVETFVLKTAGEPVALRLTADRSQLRADGQDLAFVTVEAVDRDGRWNPTAGLGVTFDVTGAGTLAGAGSGDMTAMETYAGGACRLFQGRALAVVRTGARGGEIVLRARTPGLPEAVLPLHSPLP